VENLLYVPKTKSTIANVKFSGFFMIPGSFNPIHIGHRTLGKQDFYPTVNHANYIFEMSVFNVDKPPISRSSIVQRLNNFLPEDHPVLITKTPLFNGKLDHF
jgi:hypothetical protein